MTARQKIAYFTRSKLGAFALYGSMLTAPIIGVGIAYDAVVMDMDNSTNPTSKQAVNEYINQYKPLTVLYDDIITLRKSAEQQQGADNVLSVKEKMRAMEKELREAEQNLSVNITNDTRLTEADYAIVRDTVYSKSKFRSYMSPKLSDVANALLESRAIATGDTPLAKATNIQNSMDNENSRTFVLSSGVAMILIYSLFLTGFIEGNLGNTHKKLANKIEKGGKPKVSH